VNQSLNISEFERKMFRSIFQDGIWDVAIGLLLVAMGSHVYFSREMISWGYLLPDLHVISIGLYGVVLSYAAIAKRLITIPRIGIVRFGPVRKMKLRDFGIFLGAIAILGLVVGVLVSSGLVRGTRLQGWLNPVSVIWIMVFVSGFGIAARLTAIRRFFVYGLLFASVLPLGLYLKQIGMPGILYLYILAVAFLIVAVGCRLMTRFIREYPIGADGDDRDRAGTSHD